MEVSIPPHGNGGGDGNEHETRRGHGTSALGASSEVPVVARRRRQRHNAPFNVPTPFNKPCESSEALCAGVQKAMELAGVKPREAFVPATFFRFCNSGEDGGIARSGGLLMVIIAKQSTVMRRSWSSSVSTPTYRDVDGAGAAQFNAWGTPTLYLLAGDGRVLFPGTTNVQEALVNSAALRGEIGR